MRTRTFLYASLTAAGIGLFVACGKDPLPTSPTRLATPAVAGIQVIGPESVAAGQSVQFVANVRLAAKSGPVIATSTGVDVPKFMIRLTMSPGSNENWAVGKRLPNRFRSVSSKSVSRMPASGFSATCSTPSCDPPVHRKIVLIGYEDGWTPT